MDRLVEVVVGTNHELYTHKRPFLSTEIVLNSTTGEVRRGPGMWLDLLPIQREGFHDVEVRVAVSANVTIATALNNGDSLDGVTLVTGDKVLLMGQSSAHQNGIYTVAASPARTPNYATFDAHPGRIVKVSEGALGGRFYECHTEAGGTLGTDGIYFRETGIAPINLAQNAQFNPLSTVTPLGTDLLLVQRADGSHAKVLISAVGTLVNV